MTLRRPGSVGGVKVDDDGASCGRCAATQTQHRQNENNLQTSQSLEVIVCLFGYSDTISPEPPDSFGKSLNFGKPSFIGSTVSA